MRFAKGTNASCQLWAYGQGGLVLIYAEVIWLNVIERQVRTQMPGNAVAKHVIVARGLRKPTRLLGKLAACGIQHAALVWQSEHHATLARNNDLANIAADRLT